MLGHKSIENRSWLPPVELIGRRIGIHAALATERCAFELFDVDRLPRGVVLGTVMLHDVIPNSRSIWARSGLWHWELRDPRELPRPVQARGRLGLWRWRDRDGGAGL